MKIIAITTAFALLAVATTGCSRSKAKPANLINLEASIPAGLPFNPLQGDVITSFVNQKDSTMATLFGNDAATDYARTTPGGAYPIGSVLTLVTWSQKDDPHWFGARIPKQVKSVEIVTAQQSEGDATEYVYQIFHGDPLDEDAPDPATKPRMDAILAMRAAVMP